MRRLAAMLPALALPALAAPGTFPTRFGESGLLDVPDAENLTLGRGVISGEFRYDMPRDADSAAGPLPLTLGIGLARTLEAGLALREWGRPGDPTPSPPLFTAALKLRLLEGRGSFPAVAADVYLDRLNWKATPGLRLIASTADIGRLRFAGFAGLEAHGPTPPSVGVTAGAAASILFRPELEGVLETTYQPGGALVGGALRWSLGPDAAVGLGLSWLPSEGGWRFSLGVALGSPVLRRRAPPPPEAPAAPAAPAPPRPAVPTFADDRPHFRLRIPVRGVPGSEGEPRHLQNPPSALARGPGAAAPKARPPTSEEIKAAQAAGLQDQLLARERRLRAAEADLAAREQRIATEGTRLETTEQAHLTRERQLEGREKRLPPRPAPGQAERDARAREQKARLAEAAAARAERELRVRAEAALGREAVARAREDQLRAPISKLQADLGQEKARPRQTDLLGQLNAARERQLGAVEDRLSATRDRLDLLDKANEARGGRLSTLGQRLDSFEERLDAAQKAAEEAAAAVPSRRKPGKGEKPALVMVVKPPTSIVKVAPAPGAAPATPRAALHTGVAVEKAVAAATVVYFPASGQPMRELDRESVENIARLAARENCELLIWARAQNPGLMAEATRRAEELKLFAVKAGPLAEGQVVTRVTTRPSATGVDVVVSALRDQPLAPAAPEAGAAAPAAESLAEGETGKRQIREAVLKYRPEIEACAEAEMTRRRLQGAEATLRMRVDRQGKVARLDAGESVLASPTLEQCLRAAAAGWRFPVADAEYTVDIPITVVGAGAKP